MRIHALDAVYAVTFRDDTMAPVFRRGSLAWVDPRSRARVGDEVVVQLADGAALAKTLVRRTKRHVVLRQYNPPRDFKISLGIVNCIHAIIASLRRRR